MLKIMQLWLVIQQKRLKMYKRIFDIFFSFFCLSVFSVVIFLFWIIVSIDTKSNGLFIQERIGQFGKSFRIFKLKTIKDNDSKEISKVGNFLRKSKIDELPQLWNVIIGNMSIVGPRPDIKGYYDKLEGDERKILELKPGLTSLASIKYANEDEILKLQRNPLKYNDEVIFPDKVKMNLDYYYNRSFFVDLKIILKTIIR
jgi:lipopolysaccharide/colanic/teichoic acid biosynthesis glycosyltransferase